MREAAVAAADFDARFSATLPPLPLHGPQPRRCPTRSWRRRRGASPQPLDLPLLQLACDPLLGEHDFAAFCRRPKADPEASLVRRVLDARWEVDEAAGEGVLRFWIEATAFCHQMVRSIVGTLVDVGLGKRTAADVGAALRSRGPGAAGPVAPPHGLCLWEVGY